MMDRVAPKQKPFASRRETPSIEGRQGTATTEVRLEVYEAFRSTDIPEEEAAKVAATLSTAFGKGNPEQDSRIGTLSTDIAAIEMDVGTLRTDALAIEPDDVAIKGELSVFRWMGGVLLTMTTAILCRPFLL